MLDRAWGGSFRWRRDGHPLESRKPSRLARRPQVEDLEGRQLLTASIATIAPVSVAAGQGYQVPIDGSGSGGQAQTFTVTSSNPEIKASIAQGDFITLNISHTSSGQTGDSTFSGSLVYQDFQDLTPNTAAAFESFTNAGTMNNTTFFRIVPHFSGVTTSGPDDILIQGGPQPGSGTRPLELNQQLAFNGTGAVAVANADDATATPPVLSTDGQEFFITNGPQTELNYGYTIYGQVVSGQNLVTEIGSIPLQSGSSEPVTPVNITTSTVSTTNPNGVIHIDAIGAAAGQTATITVTAHDPSDGTTATSSFQVSTTAAATIPSTATFKPTTGTPTPSSLSVGEGETINFTAPFTSNTPSTSTSTTTADTLTTAPAHGTVTFSGTTGTYTPTPGYSGTDSFSYAAVNTNSASGANPASVTGNIVTVPVNVIANSLVNTGAVRVINSVLVVTPPPTTLKATNTIEIAQLDDTTVSPSKVVLTVTLNGKTDLQEPLSSSITQIVVYGSKANDNITIDPSVPSTINVELDGGHGGKNVLQAGSGETLEHGWFGKNTLIGGTGSNQLIGGTGHVTFKPTSTSNEIAAVTPHAGYYNYRSYHGRVSYSIKPPSDTFYTYVHGKALPIPTPKAPKTTHKTK